MNLDDISHEKTRRNLKDLVSVRPQGHLKYRSDSSLPLHCARARALRGTVLDGFGLSESRA